MSRPTKPPLDKEAVKLAIIDVCAHYLGPASRRSGSRFVWPCRGCGKPKFEATERKGGVAGCFNADCPVPTSTDAIGVIAFFEDLDPARDFRRILERGREILGHPDAGPALRRAAPEAGQRKPPPDPDLLDAVYGRLLALCPVTGRALAFWEARGVTRETAEWGRFGSVTPARARAANARLEEEFGRRDLLSVPGFFENRAGNVSFTLTGDYALIPYHDREGRVTTLEGRSMTQTQERRTSKYVSLRDSGSHLYVFPGFTPDDLEAFTEGPIGAIVAAQEGIRVGSIKGIRCHRDPDGGPLPELAGANFEGRTIPYIPDSDDPPKQDVLEEAPRAARSLTVGQGGRPALAILPRGMDLDEWLLSLPREGRRRAFVELLRGARELGATKEEEKGPPSLAWRTET